jgi:hypothetical protein
MTEIKEIVAAKINGSIITNDLTEIIAAAKCSAVYEFYDRKQMQFMAGCDLGKNWEDLSNSKTLFYLVDGKPAFEKPEVVI